MRSGATHAGVLGMRDRSVTKVDSEHAPRGSHGERYLAAGTKIAMRLWEHEKPGNYDETERAYEVVGYVIDGRAVLNIEGQTVTLEPGDSYVVPRGSRHSYSVTEPLTVVEATCPPSYVHGRDQ